MNVIRVTRNYADLVANTFFSLFLKCYEPKTRMHRKARRTFFFNYCSFSNGTIKFSKWAMPLFGPWVATALIVTMPIKNSRVDGVDGVPPGVTHAQTNSCTSQFASGDTRIEIGYLGSLAEFQMVNYFVITYSNVVYLQ